jgi:hypothetical protein
MLDWLNMYCRRYFDLVGVIDILSLDRTEYRWGDEARTYSPRSRYFIYVFQRRESA